MFKPLFYLTLAAVGASMFTGCASFDKTPEGYADLVYTKTEYNPYLSYAVNISLLAMDLRGFRYEISPVKADSEDTEGYDSYPTPIEATDSAGFVVTKTTKTETSGSKTGSDALNLAAFHARTENWNPYVEMGLRFGSWFTSPETTKKTDVQTNKGPAYEFLSDQFFAFIKHSDFDNEAAVEDYMYDQLKTAFEKGGKEVVKGGVTVTVERGCERTKITGLMNDKAKTVWMELYLARLYGTNGEVVPKCEKAAGYKEDQSKRIPMFMRGKSADFSLFHLSDGIAWTYLHKNDTHLFLKGKGATIAAKAVKYFPENAFIYIAPRQVKGHLKAPYLLDKFGRHEFGQPAQSTIPTCYSWINEKYPDAEYKN